MNSLNYVEKKGVIIYCNFYYSDKLRFFIILDDLVHIHGCDYYYQKKINQNIQNYVFNVFSLDFMVLNHI